MFSKRLLTLLLIANSLSVFCAYSCQAANNGIFETSAADKTEARSFSRLPISGKAKIGLALGGGGARGAAEVGVLKVLQKAGIEFDCVAGTSIGAVVGGFYCLGISPEVMEREFTSGSLMRNYMAEPLAFRILGAPFFAVLARFSRNKYDGLYGGDRFRNYLVGRHSTDEILIEDIKKPFAAVALNVIDGKPYMIRKGDIGYALQASCAVPALQKPVEIDGMLFSDGGVVCNLPVKQCRELGADFVVAINIDETFAPVPLKALTKPGSMAHRFLSWQLYDIDQAQAALADITIHPETTGVSLISKRKSDAQRALAAGEAAATAALPALLAKLKAIGIVPQPKNGPMLAEK